MKKFFAIAFIAATMVACNNEAETTETKTDSVAVETPVTPATDSTATPAADSTVAPAADSTVAPK